MQANKEYRYYPDAQVRYDYTGSEPKFAGYAAVYNSPSRDMGGYVEIIRPGAFTRALQNGNEIRACIDHETQKTLGLTSNGSCVVRDDNKGLWFETTIPDTSYARDAVELVKRGLIKGCSFAFWANSSLMEFNSRGERELLDLDLFDVSVVFEPAFPATSVGLRQFEKWRENQAKSLALRTKIQREKIRRIKEGF